MGDLPTSNNGQNGNDAKTIVPKPEILDFELSEDRTDASSMHVGDINASSSGSNLRSSLIGMGFSASLVNKVIEEKGEDDVELLVETLIGYNDIQKSNSQSSDSLNSLFGDKDANSPPETSTIVQPKERREIERYTMLPVDTSDYGGIGVSILFYKVLYVGYVGIPRLEHLTVFFIIFLWCIVVYQRRDIERYTMLPVDTSDYGGISEVREALISNQESDVIDGGVHIGKKASLLMMNFSVNEADFALEKLGNDASVYELVDFITAAQISENLKKETDDTPHDNEGTKENKSDKTLYSTMEKTHRLLEMGFSKNQVSLAIEKFGSDAPISELADKIFSGQTFLDTPRRQSYDSAKVKTEDFSPDVAPKSRKITVSETSRGKMPKEEIFDDFSNDASLFWQIDFQENRKAKRPKQVSLDDSSSFLDSAREEKVNPNSSRYGMQQAFNSNQCKSINKVVAKPPYFLYGNVANISADCWGNISQFLYALEPEFVNTRCFSALSRKEGYLHNLPTADRSHIVPEPPMTIQDAIPHAKKWWPSWDKRKKLSCISTGTSGISQLCERFEKLLRDSQGLLSSQQQRDILDRCETLNLVWVGPYKLGPLDPEYIERILGYPSNHTQAAGSSLTPRLDSLRHCFQTDTLGYHLSVLKSMFPGGLTMLSVFSGIGGAEVTLHRLGIKLKGVISIETSETNRRILRRWWESNGQTGELVQIEDIQALTTKRLESLIHKLGSIDFVICQNSCPQFSNSKQISNSMHPNAAEKGDDLPCFDFSLYYEFVRVLQRVRSMKR